MKKIRYYIIGIIIVLFLLFLLFSFFLPSEWDITPSFCYNTSRGNSILNWLEWLFCSIVFNI